MKKLINAIDAVVPEALAGMAAAHPDELRVDAEHRVIYRATPKAEGKVALVSGGGSGHEQDGEEHHDALNEVCPADGEEAARERVEDDDESAEEQRLRVGKREDRLEEFAARDKARRCVDDEEEQDEDGRNDAQEV